MPHRSGPIAIGRHAYGYVTKDLASLICREQKLLNTPDFLAKIDENLHSEMSHAQAAE